MRGTAKGSLELHRPRTCSAAHVRSRGESRWTGHRRLRRQRNRRIRPFHPRGPGRLRKRYRNAGLGRRIKLLQREDAIARGFELIEWTFDPLEIKNAYLNIEKLGIITRRYSVNQYGITTSPLQGGLPTDRLVAEWWLKSKRVENLLRNGERHGFQVVQTIHVPARVYEWKANAATRQRAKEIQDRNRSQFLAAFASGLCVLGYERDPEGNGRFLLGKWDENWLYEA